MESFTWHSFMTSVNTTVTAGMPRVESENAVLSLAHREDGINQIEKIIVQGITEGIFFTECPHQAAKAAYLATSIFIYPNSFEDPNRKQNINSVVDLLIRGLKNPNA